MGNSSNSTTVLPGGVQAPPPEDVESPERILELLADERVHRILAVTAEDSLTVAQIASECDLPIATAYRKVNALHSQGLLTESVQVRPNNKNVNIYTFCPVDIHVSVSGHGTPDVRFSISRPKPGN